MSRVALFSKIGALEISLGRPLFRYELDQLDRAAAVSAEVLNAVSEAVEAGGPSGSDRSRLRAEVTRLISEHRAEVRRSIEARRGGGSVASEVARLVADVAGRGRRSRIEEDIE